ncbi:hypothetical protein IW139_001388 [Coemansia sp. RSA 353]|nr:hypothetical protein GGH15_002082 [Coemansia sp. RSA 562]KAJ2175734.1 hypothetical protein GGH16_000573 [Coemansia sp. RSA 560]KAJ2197243.1 hypothetical protein GGH18_001380 [Coemansia sp. RSA 530]KAJ2224386.1 hypothetical protein IW143_000575 [Coemansia sp. RSA 520]KAJ2249106.1 hypothetical protein GGH97_001469 [Coemansia sp. RSA 475]KAJ2282669.1 hypothetical protein GGH14_001424 [Coemansia sp. RSA 370]KAJ2299991.1 hypothetical protein IW139_001388 [Coemansia sp. RSA 353]KAJ2554532.1 hyp
MKFTTVIAFIVGAVTGYAQPANDAAATCTKACQVAPSEQRETCLRVCTQFAEQSAGFELAAAASPSSLAKNMPTMSVKNSELPAAANSAAASGKKMHGEDNDEDHEMNSMSMSASHMSSGAQALHIGVGTLVAALSAAAFF